MFQSSPSPKTGRYVGGSSEVCAKYIRFQSSPSPKTGRYTSRIFINWCNNVCSNPHPVRRLGATTRSLIQNARLLSSNPHPVRRLGATALTYQHLIFAQFQSSPSPKTGRYDSKGTVTIQVTGSNPHPVRRLGATTHVTRVCT